MEVEKRSYGVDVSSYNATDLSSMGKAGAKFAIVKLSEGLDYRNPKAEAQFNLVISSLTSFTSKLFERLS